MKRITTRLSLFLALFLIAFTFFTQETKAYIPLYNNTNEIQAYTANMTIPGEGTASGLGTYWYQFTITFARPVSAHYVLFGDMYDQMLFTGTSSNNTFAILTNANTSMANNKSWNFYIGDTGTFYVHFYDTAGIASAYNTLRDYIQDNFYLYYDIFNTTQVTVVNSFMNRYTTTLSIEGYNAGYIAGNLTGTAIGYETGYIDGYEQGIDDMYYNGSSTYGYNRVNSSDYIVGNIAGINVGYDVGYEDGQLDIFLNGSNIYGFDLEDSKDYIAGYDIAYEEGQDDLHQFGSTVYNYNIITSYDYQLGLSNYNQFGSTFNGFNLSTSYDYLLNLELAGSIYYKEGQDDLHQFGSMVNGYNIEDSKDYQLGIAYGASININSGISNFLSSFDKWIIPTIVIVLLLGGAVVSVRKRRG